MFNVQIRSADLRVLGVAEEGERFRLAAAVRELQEAGATQVTPDTPCEASLHRAPDVKKSRGKITSTRKLQNTDTQPMTINILNSHSKEKTKVYLMILSFKRYSEISFINT